MLIVFCVIRQSKGGGPPWVGGWTYVAVLVVCEVWEVCWILKGFWFFSMFLLSDGSLIQMWSASFAEWCGLLLPLSLIVKFFFCFRVICRDMVASHGTCGLISMVWNSFFQGPIGFTYLFSCTVVGWAFTLIDYNCFALWMRVWITENFAEMV